MRVGSDGDRYRSDAEGEECVAIARVAGFDHPDSIARIESRQKSERETSRCAGHDENRTRIDCRSVRLAVVLSDAIGESGKPGRIGVAEWPIGFEFGHHGSTCTEGCARARLADLQEHRR